MRTDPFGFSSIPERLQIASLSPQHYESSCDDHHQSFLIRFRDKIINLTVNYDMMD